MQVTFIAQDGASTTLEAEAQVTLRDLAKDRGIDGIVGECGGMCACATCRVYVALEWTDKLQPPSAMELELLDFELSDHPEARLGCQITLDQSLDGLVVRLPASQY
jgi:2Fe-2S ferredoxin